MDNILFTLVSNVEKIFKNNSIDPSYIFSLESVEIKYSYIPKKFTVSKNKCYLHILPPEIISLLVQFCRYLLPQINMIYFGEIGDCCKFENAILSYICIEGDIKLLEEDLNFGLKLRKVRQFQNLLLSGERDAVDWIINYVDNLEELYIPGYLDNDQILELISVGAKINHLTYDTAVEYNMRDN